ncbi:hypothetical protein BGLA2_500037 [Burkholderia gladioli]|nr:hypothetical protein BGLA2_500037 [Burkholderia gladioli]
MPRRSPRRTRRAASRPPRRSAGMRPARGGCGPGCADRSGVQEKCRMLVAGCSCSASHFFRSRRHARESVVPLVMGFVPLVADDSLLAAPDFPVRSFMNSSFEKDCKLLKPSRRCLWIAVGHIGFGDFHSRIACWTGLGERIYHRGEGRRLAPRHRFAAAISVFTAAGRQDRARCGKDSPRTVFDPIRLT